jgi:hypothetical protein
MTDLLFNREVSVKFTDRDNPADVVVIEDPKIPGKEPIKIDFQVEEQLSTEPNRADLAFWNLRDDTAAKINFRKPILEFKFGRKVELFAGFEERSKRIFSGVVIAAITSREGKLKITRVECRNIFYELMQLPINKTFAKGQLKSNAILTILKEIDATIDGKAKGVLISRLNGQVFKDATTFKGTAYNVINEINRGLLGVVNIYFDDIAASFNPVGVPLDEPPIIYDQETGLIGTPKPTPIGADFIVQLDNELKISSPVLLLSDTIQAFKPSARFVVKRIAHAGTNRADGDFETRAVSVFDRTKQIDMTIGVA